MIDPVFWLQWLWLWIQFHLLESVAFLLGLSIIPLLSLYGPHPLISELIADVNVTMGQLILSLQHRGSKLYQTAEDTYEIRPLTEDDEPLSHATRMGGAPFGMDYAREATAFGNDEVEAVAPDELPSQAREQTVREQRLAQTDGGEPQPTPLDDKLLCTIERGGVRTWMDPDDVRDDGETLFANMAAKLPQYRAAAGMRVANTALMRSMSEYGGDSSDIGSTAQLVGFFLSLILGLAFGVFFIL